MNLANYNLIYLLIIIIPAIGLIIIYTSKFKERFGDYAEPMFFPVYFKTWSFFYAILRLVLLLLALISVIFALVRPQWDYSSTKVSKAGIDIIFCIDVSKSMDAQDMQPSRLFRAKIQIASFLDKLQSDRVAIVSFAGLASLDCPLTDDYEAAKMILNSLTTSSIPEPGTNIGDALEVAQKALSTHSNSNIIILISDGEDLSGKALIQARAIKRKNTPVYTMGVGTEQGVELSPPTGKRKIITKLDVNTLKKIAEITNGEFYLISPNQVEIRELLDIIYKQEKNTYSSKNINLYKEQYHIFAILTIILLLVESLLNPRILKRKTSVS